MKRSELYEAAVIFFRVLNIGMFWLIIASGFLLAAFDQYPTN
jgi:hypothetical protein